MFKNLLPKILAEITGKPRIKVENLEWDKNLWVANIFRLWELLFWKEGVENRDGTVVHKAQVQAYGYGLKDKYGFLSHRNMRYETLEGKLIHYEAFLKHNFKALFNPKTVYDFKIPYALAGFAVLLFFINPFTLTFTMPMVMGAIAIDTNSTVFTKTASAATSLTLTYTSSGSDRYALIYGLDVTSADTSPPNMDATYNSVVTPLIGQVSRGDTGINSLNGYIFGKYAQATGSVNVVINRPAGGTHWIEGAVISLTGALQSDTADASEFTQPTSRGTNQSESSSTVTDNDAVFVWLLNDNGGGFTISAGVNSTYLFQGDALGFANGHRVYKSSTFPYTPAGSLTTTWTQNGSGNWFYAFVAIAPAGGAAAYKPKILGGA